jgi:iron uptake system EfeUOB component EfeO/EfeM
MQFDPGINHHDWESRWSSLEDDVRTSPEEALPELADLAQEMLAEAGYDITDPVARAGEEREVVTEYLAAREIADLVDAGQDVDPGDVASAINGLTAIRDFVFSFETGEP